MKTLAVAILSVSALTHAYAEDTLPTLTVNWPSRSKPCPAALKSGTNIKIVVENVNDVLYDYGVEFSSFVSRSDDIKNVSGEKQSASPITACSQILQQAEIGLDRIIAALKAQPALSPPVKGRSIPLGDTLTAWAALNNAFSLDIATLKKALTCQSGDESEVRRRSALAEKAILLLIFELRVARDHKVTYTAFLNPDSTSTIKISESLNGVPTTTGIHKWRCGDDDTLTLSMGVLVTSVPYRTYEARKTPLTAAAVLTPGATPPTSEVELAVTGNSKWTPQGAALLNYKIPLGDRAPSWLGLAVSTGPVFKFGGTPNVSNFGYFGGVSVHIWRRFFFTPGLHIGEFADFPAGFRPGQKVPDGFGELNPVKRWTTKFSFGITYQTFSFKQKFGLAEVATPPKPVTPAPAKKDPPVDNNPQGTGTGGTGNPEKE